MFSPLFHLHTNNYQHSWKWSVINPYHYVDVYSLCNYAGVDGLNLVLKSRQQAPLQTLPCLRSRGNVMHSNVSELRIVRRFDRMDRKACTRIKGPTIQRKDMSKSAIHLPGRSQAYNCNVSATEGRGEPEGGRPASPRPAGLALSAFGQHKLHRLREAIRDVHAKAVARWTKS